MAILENILKTSEIITKVAMYAYYSICYIASRFHVFLHYWYLFQISAQNKYFKSVSDSPEILNIFICAEVWINLSLNCQSYPKSKTLTNSNNKINACVTTLIIAVESKFPLIFARGVQEFGSMLEPKIIRSKA